MSIRPIDMQVIIPRSVEMSRVQQIAEHQTVINQEQLSEKTKNLVEHRNYQVQNTQKNEGRKVKREKEEQEEKQKQKKKKHYLYGQNANLEEENLDEEAGHSIDIKS